MNNEHAKMNNEREASREEAKIYDIQHCTITGTSAKRGPRKLTQCPYCYRWNTHSVILKDKNLTCCHNCCGWYFWKIDQGNKIIYKTPSPGDFDPKPGHWYGQLRCCLKCGHPEGIHHPDCPSGKDNKESSIKTLGQQKEDTAGRKNDEGKRRWNLMPWNAVEEVVKVLEFGAYKYGRNTWKYESNARMRYFDVAMRHLLAWKNKDERTDKDKCDEESGLPHLAHAACCILFMLAIDKKEVEDDNM